MLIQRSLSRHSWAGRVPRTSNRRWKGCPLCKDHKHAGHGDAVRMPFNALRKLGKKRRVSRKDTSDGE